jgi:hypothetical protein
MGDGALANGPKLPRPSSTLPSRQPPDGRYRIIPTVARAVTGAAPDPAIQEETLRGADPSA